MTQGRIDGAAQQPGVPADVQDFVLEHYRALRERFKSQGDRLWQRFNYFLTVEVALAAAFLWRGTAPPRADLETLGPILGVILSVFWFVIAAQDLWFYEDARKRLEAFKSRCVLPAIPSWAGEGDKFLAACLKRLICFKIPKVGVTTLAPIPSLLFAGFWLLVVWHR